MQPGPPLAGAVREATEAGTGPGCSPDTGDRRSWGGRAHARCVVATAETAIYGAGRPTPQERRPAAAGPTDAPGSHDVRRPEAQPRAWRSGGHDPDTAAARGSRPGTCPSAKVAGTAHLTHPRLVVPTAAGVWSSAASYHLTITPRPWAANVQPSRIMPDHQLLRSCFLTVYPRATSKSPASSRAHQPPGRGRRHGKRPELERASTRRPARLPSGRTAPVR
jgi:hypothetical protein